jgi:hypothetical protein
MVATLERRPPPISASISGLATVVALAMALGSAAPAHAATPWSAGLAHVAAPRGGGGQADFEQLIAEADAHSSAGRHAEALKSYVDAFTAMPAELRASSVGQFVALAAANAAQEDFRARGDATSLDKGRDVLRAFVLVAQATDREGTAELVTEAQARLTELEQLRSSPSPAAEPDPSASASDDGLDTPPSDGPTPSSGGPTPDHSRLGIALAVSGGVVLLGGLGLMIAGARQVPWYEEELAGQGWATTDPGYDQEIAQAQGVRNVDYGIGAAMLVIGVGLGVTGAVLLTKSKQRRRELSVAPVLGRDRAMLGARWRF